MKRLVLISLLAACSSKSSDVTTENGVRVNYVTAGIWCGQDEVCEQSRSGPQRSWACGRAVTKTTGADGELACFATLTMCIDAVGAVREAMVRKDADMADYVSVGECEIYRVRAK